MLVYKYLSPERIDVLENGCIRFTQPLELNDPFESLPNTLKVAEQEYESFVSHHEQNFRLKVDPRSDDFFPEFLSEQFKILLSQNFLILSVSKNWNNLLMWSHYSDSHQGYVVGFDSEHEFFSPDTGKNACGLREISYQDERAILNDGITEPIKPNWAEEILFTKSPDWRYEAEMRVIAKPKNANKTIPVEDKSDICLFDFPPEAVQEIYLGCRSVDPLYEQVMRLWLEKYSHASCYTCMADNEEFAVGRKQVTPKDARAWTDGD